MSAKLWHVDIIRIDNGGRVDLPHTAKIGMAVVSVQPGAQPFWNEQRHRRWMAVAYVAIGHMVGPGTYSGEFTTEVAALAAARSIMLANGWYETEAECVTAGLHKLKADRRFREPLIMPEGGDV